MQSERDLLSNYQESLPVLQCHCTCVKEGGSQIRNPENWLPNHIAIWLVQQFCWCYLFLFAPTASVPRVDILNVIPKKKERRSYEAPSASEGVDWSGVAASPQRNSVRPSAQRNSFCPKQVWGVRSFARSPFRGHNFRRRPRWATIGFRGRQAAAP